MNKKKKILNYDEAQYKNYYSKDFNSFEEYMKADEEIRKIRLFKKEKLYGELIKRLEKSPNNQLYLKILWQYHIDRYELDKAREVTERLIAIAPRDNREFMVLLNNIHFVCTQAIGSGNIHEIPTEKLKTLYNYRREHYPDNDIKYDNKLLEEIILKRNHLPINPYFSSR